MFLSSGLTDCDIYDPAIHNQELLWVAFIAWLADHRQVRMSTGKHYLFGIQSLLLEAGHHVPILRFKQVRRALKAWGKREGPSTTRPKLPITTSLLRSAAPSFSKHNHHDRVIWAMVTLGVYGLLRCGELVSDAFDPSHFPRFRHWSLLEGGTIGRFHLALSKSDVFSHGTYVYVAANFSDTCPVTAVQAMVLLAPFKWYPESPLFTFDGIHPLSRSIFLSNVRKLFGPITSPLDISGHSFRRGGAQSLYDAGVPIQTIRNIGRWKSDIVMQRYYGLSTDKLRSISSAAASSFPSRILNFHLLASGSTTSTDPALAL